MGGTNETDDIDEGWDSLLRNHPVFASTPRDPGTSLTPSTKAGQPTSQHDGSTFGRRQVMALKGTDLFVAVGKDIRVASLGDHRLSRNMATKSFKMLAVDKIDFPICSLSLNPSGKLLAVSGTFEVVIVILPRPGFTRMVPAVVQCKYVVAGDFHHNTSSAAIAKVDWHPWGDGGSTLLVLTVDGIIREYDVSVDVEEPQQTLSFVPQDDHRASFHADDPADREATSFTLGKGEADWGPLTVYALTRSGDIYSICPYLPVNACIPASYVHALQCFINAKQESLSQGTSNAGGSLSTIYDFQSKYVDALMKQLPVGTHLPDITGNVRVHPPKTVRQTPACQGPFLLQPSPRTLSDGEATDATDIIYLTFGSHDESDGDENGTEHLGAVLIVYQDGKVDVCLDVEKVEARWDDSHRREGLGSPMLAVYESIDLGLTAYLQGLSSTAALWDMLSTNHPIFCQDPINPSVVYVAHTIGVHRLDLGPVFHSFIEGLNREDDDDAELMSVLDHPANTKVLPVLSTFSVERRSSNPVIGVILPNDVYLSYGILILTSSMRITTLLLDVTSEISNSKSLLCSSTASPRKELSSSPQSSLNKEITRKSIPPPAPPAYISLLSPHPFQVGAALSRPAGLPSNPLLLLPEGTAQREMVLTQDTMRFLATTVSQILAQSEAVQLAYHEATTRAGLQQREIIRMCAKSKELLQTIERIKARRKACDERFAKAKEAQGQLFGRLERVLQMLMHKTSPELSEQEVKWFAELKRMKQEIRGSGRSNEGSLAARARTLRIEHDRLMPSIRALKAREQKLRASTNGQTLDVAQAFELGERSNLESVRWTQISNLERQITKLAAKVDVNLGAPPSRIRPDASVFNS
ncbi:hypothetical protein FISHEDRAFT_65459 [Fistulina hepatica ATCC 64428]|nr:hypothetical protein FISHEDRAFT_65459 [Fistulina hepatica ATCC 64428]